MTTRAKLLTIVCAFGWAASSVMAQQAPAGQKETSQQKETRLRFDMLSSRAAANFRSADAIEASLRTQGWSLHPQILSLRFRVEAALDEAEGALRQGDFEAAHQACVRGEEFLNRLARRLGGD